eukprot:gb/GFBE01019664.1/.p1 GENE.gb/GFBE01019664.1/~~gb/GFBE01019664.1/.p1  ORF type:complete len:402 (+),score=61.77 gb/GFBE01019664.1/:1-1206(+)
MAGRYRWQLPATPDPCCATVLRSNAWHGPVEDMPDFPDDIDALFRGASVCRQAASKKPAPLFPDDIDDLFRGGSGSLAAGTEMSAQVLADGTQACVPVSAQALQAAGLEEEVPATPQLVAAASMLAAADALSTPSPKAREARKAKCRELFEPTPGYLHGNDANACSERKQTVASRPAEAPPQFLFMATCNYASQSSAIDVPRIKKAAKVYTSAPVRSRSHRDVVEALADQKEKCRQWERPEDHAKKDAEDDAVPTAAQVQHASVAACVQLPSRFRKKACKSHFPTGSKFCLQAQEEPALAVHAMVDAGEVTLHQSNLLANSEGAAVMLSELPAPFQRAPAVVNHEVGRPHDTVRRVKKAAKHQLSILAQQRDFAEPGQSSSSGVQAESLGSKRKWHWEGSH